MQNDRARLIELIKQTPEWEPSFGIRREDDTAPAVESSPAWPCLAEEALHGLAGETVRLIEPHTESDPVALLVQFLAGFGNLIGRTAHFKVEQTVHYLKLFAVLVGESSKSRKGTSWEHVNRLLRVIDREWAEARVMSGLASGEGLTWAVRDPIEKDEPVKDKGQITGYQTVIIDQGVKDKRLLVLEQEFSSVLRVAAREGSTLSATIRQAWDSENLRILTKNTPARATGAHISILGHITREELLRALNATEQANGFANRFLWVCVRRSKCLPEGSNIESVDFGPIVRRLATAVEFAGRVGELRKDTTARELWAAVYDLLSEGKPGLLGAITARGEPQTMRLACIYALLDQSPEIRAEHLQAGLAMWQYCEDSARYIFGAATGDWAADKILEALKDNPAGMTRNEIRELFQRNLSAERIDSALRVLSRLNLAYSKKEEPGQTAGRPAERWFCRRRGYAVTR